MAHRSFAVIAILFAPAAVNAHPGHGATDGVGPIHHMVEPEHSGLALLALGALVVICGLWRYHRARR